MTEEEEVAEQEKSRKSSKDGTRIGRRPAGQAREEAAATPADCATMLFESREIMRVRTRNLLEHRGRSARAAAHSI